jgi:hypothetical protein
LRFTTRPENVLRVLVLLASAKPPRLRNITHTRKISFSGLVIQITIVYQSQKVHLFDPSLGFLVEAQPRLENRREQKALFGRGAY